MMDDAMAAELKNVLGVSELPPECEHWKRDTFRRAIESAKSGAVVCVRDNDGLRFVFSGGRLEDALQCNFETRNSHPLYDTQLRLIGKLKAAIGSCDGKREGEAVDVALERIVDEACVHFTRIRSLQLGLIDKLKTAFRLLDNNYSGSTVEGVLLLVVSDACDRYQSRMSATESDYAATVKALSDAIQVLAKEQKQTYASCNALSNTLAEVVKNRMKLEESR